MDDTATTNPQELWQAMVAAAVLGTDRAGKTPPLPQQPPLPVAAAA